MKRIILLPVFAFIAAVLIASNVYPPAEKLRVMILDFDTGTGITQAQARTLTITLSEFLQENFEVVHADEVHRIISEQGFSPSSMTEQQMDLVDSLLNIQTIISGAIDMDGRRFAVTALIVNAQTSEVERSIVLRGDILSQLEQRMGRSIANEMNRFMMYHVYGVDLRMPARNAPQPGDWSVGVSFAHYRESDFFANGIRGLLRFQATDAIRLEGTVAYLPRSIINPFGIPSVKALLDTSLNVHYLFPVSGSVVLYPLAGIGLATFITTATGHGLTTRSYDNHLILNVGIGMDLRLNHHLSMNLEPRIMQFMSEGTRTSISLSAGIVFCF